MSFSLPLLACRNTPHPLQISVLSPPPLLPFPSLGPRLSPCRPHWPRQYKHHLSPRAAGPDFPLAFLRLFFSWRRCRRLLMWPGFHLLGLFVGLAGAGLLAHDPAKKTPSLLLPRPYSPLFRLMDLDLAFLRLFFSWRRCRCSVMLAGRHLHCLFVGLAGAGLLAHDPAKKTPRLLLPWPHFPLFHLMDLDLERTKEEMIGSGENKRRNEKVPLVCSTHTDVNSMQPSRVTDFVALASAGFRIEDLANLSTNTLFNLKPNTHTIINDPIQFGNYRKFISPTDTTTTAAAAATTTAGPQALVQQKGAAALQYTPAIDVWSIGCIFDELLIGWPLIPGKNE